MTKEERVIAAELKRGRTPRRDWVWFFFVDHLRWTLVGTYCVLLAFMALVVVEVANHSDDIGHNVGHFVRSVVDGFNGSGKHGC